MSWQIVEHTADVRIHVTAATLEELFADSMRALMDVMRSGRLQPADRGLKRAATLNVSVEASDLTALLVDFLNEVLAIVHTKRLTLEPESIVLEGSVVNAVLRPRGSFDEDVKAVTYHEADVRRIDHGWTTALVLDI